MAKFNVGDRVRFIGIYGKENESYAAFGGMINPGDLGRVTRYDAFNDHYPYSLEFDKGLTIQYARENEIVLVEPEPTPEPEWKTVSEQLIGGGIEVRIQTRKVGA